MALLGYAVGAAGLLSARREPRWSSLARLAWTVGCIAYLGHVYPPFQFYHDWSHASAFEETARQTHETVGWEVGEGLFVSYFFTLVWVSDVIWWWLAGAQNYYRRPRALDYCTARVFLLYCIQRHGCVRVGRSSRVGTGIVRRTGPSLVDRRQEESYDATSGRIQGICPSEWRV